MNGHDDILMLLQLDRTGERSPAEEERLQRHLATCPDCRAAAETVRRTRERYDALTRSNPPGMDAHRAASRVMGTIATPARSSASWADLLHDLAGRTVWRTAYACSVVLTAWGLLSQTLPSDQPTPRPSPRRGADVLYVVSTSAVLSDAALALPDDVRQTLSEHPSLELRQGDVRSSLGAMMRMTLRTFRIPPEQQQHVLRAAELIRSTATVTYRLHIPGDH